MQDKTLTITITAVFASVEDLRAVEDIGDTPRLIEILADLMANKALSAKRAVKCGDEPEDVFGLKIEGKTEA